MVIWHKENLHGTDKFGITAEMIKRFRFKGRSHKKRGDIIYINNIIRSLKFYQKHKDTAFPEQKRRDLVLKNILNNHRRELELIRPMYTHDEGGVWLFDFGGSYHIVHELMTGKNLRDNRKMDRLDRGYPIDKFGIDRNNLILKDGDEIEMPEHLDVSEFYFHNSNRDPESVYHDDYLIFKKYIGKKVKIREAFSGNHNNSIWCMNLEEIEDWNEEDLKPNYFPFAIIDFPRFSHGHIDVLGILEKMKNN